ncbi:MAG: ABC transporter substrate-binding protein, partial [Dehalococcoidia bacterium]
NAQFTQLIVGLEAPDDYTVKVTLSRPSASFLSGVATPHFLMYPAHQQDLQAWQKAPVGTGPFKFDSFVVDRSLDLVRNDSYFKKDEAGRALPFLDGVVYHVINDAAAAFAAFRTGRTDCGCTFDTDFMTPNRASILKEFPDGQYAEFWAQGYLYFNQRPPFDDIKVRQAISIGIDRRLFAEALQEGFTHFPGSFFFPPEVGGQWGLTAEEMLQLPGWREDRAADLALAEQLFAEAGIDPGDITLELLATTQFETDLILIDAALREIGIVPKLKILPRGSAREDRMQGLFDISYETPGPAFDDPKNQGAGWIVTGTPSNYGKWANPEIDQLFADIDLELDPVKRLVIAKELQHTLIDFAAMVPMPYNGRFQGVREYVKGWQHISPIPIDVSGRLERVWLDR